MNELLARLEISNPVIAVFEKHYGITLEDFCEFALEEQVELLQEVIDEMYEAMANLPESTAILKELDSDGRLKDAVNEVTSEMACGYHYM